MESSSTRPKRQVSFFLPLQFDEIFWQFVFYSYQAEVNRSMSVYRQKYEDWFNQLTDVERKAETARMNSSKSVKRQPAAAKNANNASTTTTINEPKFVNVPSNVTPAGPAFSIANLTPVVMQSGQQIQMQPQQPLPVQQKDRQTLLDDILKREPVEPARSAKQLFVNEFLGKYQMSQHVIIKCKRSSLRSQCCKMRLFLWLFNLTIFIHIL